MFDDKFHQVAIYTSEPLAAVSAMTGLGYTEWKHDTARLVGEVYGDPIEAYGEMWFNYHWGPNELEFLRYDGDSWHKRDGRLSPDDEGIALAPFLSHKSLYVEDCFRGPEANLLLAQGFTAVQWFETHDHTNPYLINKRQRFIETIWGTRHLFGFDTKLIQRIFD